MKKTSVLIACIFMISLLLCFSASAETITAMAIEINPDHLEKTAAYARILGYHEENNTLTVELIAPEVFRRDEVEALRVGDGIYTGGQEVAIQTIERDEWGNVVINAGEYEFADGSVNLFLDLDNNYRPMIYDDYVWLSLTVMECPVTDSLLFLDYIDQDSGEPLTLPVVHTARELTGRLLEEDASEVYTVGLSTNNVYVVFDAAGQLATIQRFYVPWQ